MTEICENYEKSEDRNVVGSSYSNESGGYSINLTVTNELGIHGRPAVLIVRVCKKYNRTTSLILDGMEVSGKSIMGVMTLEASKGKELKIKSGSKKCLEELVVLFENNFSVD